MFCSSSLQAVSCARTWVLRVVQGLPANGKRYHEIRQGKLPMLPGYSVQYQNLLKVSRIHHDHSSEVCVLLHLWL